MAEYWYRYRDDLWKRVTIYCDEKRISFRDEGGKNDEKLACNIRRAQRCIEGYALCNTWDWFITCTLDPSKYNRNDLSKFHKDLTQLMRDFRKRFGDIQFLFVPELHKNRDGWHMHGLVKGIPLEQLRLFTLSEKLPKYIRDKLKSGAMVYDFPAYRDRFGFVDVEPVRSRDAAARYVTKYITKDTQAVTARNMSLHDHLYYVSNGLLRPQRVETENAPGVAPDALPSWLVEGNSFEFDYGEVHWYETPRRHTSLPLPDCNTEASPAQEKRG